MEEHLDKLEKILKRKSNILSRIYEINDEIRSSSDPAKADYEDYDSYIEEKGTLLDELDALDTESDEITEYLQGHREVIDKMDPRDRERMLNLMSEINGRIEAVRNIEGSVKEDLDQFFRLKRDQIRDSRKQVKVLQAYKTGY